MLRTPVPGIPEKNMSCLLATRVVDYGQCTRLESGNSVSHSQVPWHMHLLTVLASCPKRDQGRWRHARMRNR